ncbi:lipase domain-containing protein [Trichonephila clavata]|uniref:Lipase domain-containing protein n=1 Tax=Trichonephila clavata TaxID=2740835 RepID=A0A8X6KUS6_TRICU|nr:lipase domain-containing protein [Trichonephila clavata]
MSQNSYLSKLSAVMHEKVSWIKIPNFVTGMGYPYSSGHFDFYVNGGSKQPGCKDANEYISEMTSQEWKSTLNYLFGPIDSETFETVDKYLLCNHIRALDVFLASIENESCAFMARECSSWSRYLSGECDNHDVVVMGHRADMYKKLINNSPQMKFYLKTDAIYPYCLQ